MSANQASNPFDLLGQAPAAVAPVRLPGKSAPILEVGWGEYRQGLLSLIAALVTRPAAPRQFLSGGFFKDSWIERRLPRRALIAAALWHIAFLALPLPQFSAPRRNAAFDNTELTWSGPIEDLPLVNLPAERPKPSPRGEREKPLPREGGDTFHPRQRIFTDPVHPTHPRQTLINPAAPPEAPKILPNLPNVVQLAPVQAPPRPHLQISEEALSKLHPVERRVANLSATPAPSLQDDAQDPVDLTLAMQPNQPARPKLELNARSAPIVAKRKGADAAEPAPDVGTAQPASSNGAAVTFIALSETPGPPAPVVQPPRGNLAARVSISPEGKTPGVPGGSPAGPDNAKGSSDGNTASKGGTGGGAGNNSVGVSISGGNPRPGNSVSGLGGIRPKLNLSASHPAFIPSDSAAPDTPPVRSSPPNFDNLPPGAKPEQIFGPKRVYRMRIDMPNLNSATGSWILNFSELGSNTGGPHVAGGDDVNGPEPLRKVDPRYPPTLIDEHVEGEVVLYAVIRQDGSVDSIQLVRGIDEQLDANAMHALSQWKFRPATKEGEPVELEAIVHIPFRAPSFR